MTEADISSTVYLFVLIILQDIYLLVKKDHNPWILLRTLLGNAVYEEFTQSTSAVDEVPSVLILHIFCSDEYKPHLLNVQTFERLCITCNGKTEVSYLKEQTKIFQCPQSNTEVLKKEKKRPPFPLNHMETFIKVLSAQLWLSSLELYHWDFQTSQHQNTNAVIWFHSEKSWPFPAAPTHNLLPLKESLVIYRAGEKIQPNKTETNPPPLQYQEASPSPSPLQITACFAFHLTEFQAVWNLPAKFVLKHTEEVTIVSEVSSQDGEPPTKQKTTF